MRGLPSTQSPTHGHAAEKGRAPEARNIAQMKTLWHGIAIYSGMLPPPPHDEPCGQRRHQKTDHRQPNHGVPMVPVMADVAVSNCCARR